MLLKNPRYTAMGLCKIYVGSIVCIFVGFAFAVVALKMKATFILLIIDCYHGCGHAVAASKMSCQ